MRMDYPYDPNFPEENNDSRSYADDFSYFDRPLRQNSDVTDYSYSDPYTAQDYYNEPQMYTADQNLYPETNYYSQEQTQYYSNEEKQEYFDSYNQNYQSENLVDITSTQDINAYARNSGYIQRNMENSEYILYGQAEGDNVSDTREMTSVSETMKQKTPPIGNNAKMSWQAKREAKRKTRIKARRNRRVFRIVWILMVVIAGVIIGQYLAHGAGDVFGMDRQAEGTANIKLESGATIEEVAELLYDEKVIDSKEFFKLYCTFTNVESFNHGDFQIPTNMDYEAIINFLWSDTNRTDVVEIMFYEGMNVLEMAELLEEMNVCSADAFLKAANSNDFDDYDIVKMIPSDRKKYYKLEGYLFPDTYQFYEQSDPKDVISKMLYNAENKLFDDDIQERMTALNMTMDDLIIFASIVQAEASGVEDMYNVSSVIHNRLDYGYEYDIYTLGMESTLYYPYRRENQVPADKKGYVSDYETYNQSGLPSGAVCNPGMSAIDAALNPNATDYLYFLHDPDGNSLYAETREEHEQNYIDAGLEHLYNAEVGVE